MKIAGFILLLQAFICFHFAQAAVNSARPDNNWAQPIEDPTDRRRSISVQYTSNDDDSNEETESRPYPLKGLSINVRLNYDKGLENVLQVKGKDTWTFLEKVAAEAQDYFLYTNKRPYLRLSISKGDSFTLGQSEYGNLGVRNLDSFAARSKPANIDADIYIAKQPMSVDEYAFVYQNKVCRDKGKSVALVLHNSLDSEAITGAAVATSIASLLGLCKNGFTWNMKDLFKRYEEGRLPCLKDKCLDHDSCSSKSASSCSDKVTGFLCPKMCNQCLILYPRSGLSLRLRLNYNNDFEMLWKSKGTIAAMYNIVAHGETYFLDDDKMPYLRFEIVNGTKFNNPSTEDLTVEDLDKLINTISNYEERDAEIFFGKSYGHIVLGSFYGNAKFNSVCINKRNAAGMVLQSSMSNEAGTADTLSKMIGSLLGLWSEKKSSWTMQEFKEAYESGKYQCLQPYKCHDQSICSVVPSSSCSTIFTKHLCPKMCTFCRTD